MAIAQNYPNIVPSLSLDFANVKALDPRITFTRASSATYYGTETAKAEENLLSNSNSFSDTTYWIASDVALESSTDPSGGNAATRVTATATNATHAIDGNNAFGGNRVAYAASQTLTYSIFAKKDTHDFFQIVQAGVTGAHANFDLATGVVGDVVGIGVSPSASMTEFPVGSGWYRCVLTFTPIAAVATGSISLILVSSNTAARRAAFSAAGTEAVDIFGAQAEQRSQVTAYTPTTTQPITNYIPVLESAASGVARFDHNPVTKESLGLLIEEQRTNLLLRSEEFDNAAWVKTRASITANTIVAPDGSLTGDKIIGDLNSTNPFINRSISETNGNAYAFSVYAKADDLSFLRLTNGSANLNAVWFDLFNGTVGSVIGVGNSASITPVGNEWYRCVFNISSWSSFGSNEVLIGVTNEDGATTSFTGDGTSGIFIWGAQLEAGAFATSYIPTSASQVTRAADAASMTGANFSSWFNAGEGTLFSEVQNAVSGPDILTVSNNTTANRFGILYNSSLQGRVTVNNVSVVANAGNLITGFNKIASAASVPGGLTAALNGAVSTTQALTSMPISDRAYIGAGGAGAIFNMSMHIRKIAYYPIAATPAQLQGLTS